MKTIGKYEVRGLLGRGGMGAVYKVRLPVVGKLVALKLLAPHPYLVTLLGEEEIRRRFVAEAVTMARLRHPNIVAIWDFHDSDDLTFFVMEYFCKNLGSIIGETYRTERASRILSVDKAIDYTVQILTGLERLHHAGIVHRDVKPYNVLVTEQDTAKLTDFGLSALHGELFGGPSNLMVGSPYYAAPEQETDPNGVDCRADLYSVGVMLYRMLTGGLPQEERKPLELLHSDLDEQWDAFVVKSLARERGDRFHSAESMMATLENLNRERLKKKEKVCAFSPETDSPETEEVSSHMGQSRLHLRSKPVKVRPKAARDLFGVDGNWRPRAYVENDFQLHGEDEVRDRRTGLTWQRGGSDYPLTWREARDYVAALNRDASPDFPWRLPTIAELMSLITEIPRAGDLCTAPVFSTVQRWLWSCDRQSFVAAWYADAELGYIAWQDFSCYYYVRAVRSEPA